MSRSLVFRAILYVSESRCFGTTVSESRIFDKQTRSLEFSPRQFWSINRLGEPSQGIEFLQGQKMNLEVLV